MSGIGRSGKAQIALEFLIVYSFVLVIFILIFSIISTQRAATIGEQEYSLLQMQAQNIASYIDQAAQAGTGYYAIIPLASGSVNGNYNLSISSTGVVITGTKVGSQPIKSYGFSSTRNLVINGTLITSSGGIGIYAVPTYEGSISISNLGGTVYIDEAPSSLSYLPHGMITKQVATSLDASFDGTNSYIETDYLQNSISTYTIAAWVKTTNSIGNPVVQDSGNGAVSSLTLEIGYNNGQGTHSGTVNCGIGSNNVWIGGYTQQAINDGKWHFITCTFNSELGSSISPSDISVNIDGRPASLITTSTGTAISPITGVGGTIIGYSNEFNQYFNGNMTDIQFYNTAMPSNDIVALYNEGIGGYPIWNDNPIGWWPLNGNANEYAGNNYAGTPYSITYGDAAQYSAQSYSLSGNTIANSLTGFTASKGSMQGNSMSYPLYAEGFGSAFITSGPTTGTGNLSAEMFNGNSTTIGNLVAWWPLDTGYGSNIIDLSSNADYGTANGVWSWQQSINETNFAAATFPGSKSPSQIGYITINSLQPLLGISANNTFTAVAWIYYNGPTTSHNQGVFGNWPDSPNTALNGGFQLVGYCSSSCASNAVLYVDGSSINFPSGLDSFPDHEWEMVAAQYNGYTGATTIYLNGKVFVSGTLSPGLELLQTGQFYIGNDASQPSGTDTFNGMITNVQLYDSYLSEQQISKLYSEGIGAQPLGNGGLIGWWPLLNSTVDYSYNKDNGTLNGNVVFTNSAYNNTQHTAGPLYLTLNGFGNTVIPYSPKLTLPGSFSTSFWFASFNSPSQQFSYEIVSSAGGTRTGIDTQLCGGGSAGRCGFTGINATLFSGGLPIAVVSYPLGFSSNEWYSVTETFGSNVMTLYVDGQEKTSTISGPQKFMGSGGYMTVGAPTIFQGNFMGQVADLQVYNTVLTSQQAMQLYEQGLPEQEKLNYSLG